MAHRLVPDLWEGHEVEATLALDDGLGKELVIVSVVHQEGVKSFYRVKENGENTDFEEWLPAVDYYNCITEPYSREQFVGEMQVICIDLFGEEKTAENVKSMWEDQLENLYKDGYGVDLSWKPTKAELKMLMGK